MSLTQNDLDQIRNIVKTVVKSEVRGEVRKEVQASEQRLEQRIVTKFTKILDEGLDVQPDQILEYVNAFNKSHEEWLRNHDLRIVRLEENAFGQIK